MLCRKPVHEKVFLLDGHVVLIELHPHVTAQQVCTHVKSSVAMRPSAKHFALYELHHTYERAMQGDTYLCDSLFVWEQYAKKHRTVRAVRYMMKVRVYFHLRSLASRVLNSEKLAISILVFVDDKGNRICHFVCAHLSAAVRCHLHSVPQVYSND